MPRPRRQPVPDADAIAGLAAMLVKVSGPTPIAALLLIGDLDATAAELASAMRITPGTVAVWLARLRAAQLVGRRREGPRWIIRLTDEGRRLQAALVAIGGIRLRSGGSEPRSSRTSRRGRTTTSSRRGSPS